MVGWGCFALNLPNGMGEVFPHLFFWIYFAKAKKVKKMAFAYGDQGRMLSSQTGMYQCPYQSDLQLSTVPSAELQDLPQEVFAVDPTVACQTPNTEVLYRCRKCRYWTFCISHKMSSWNDLERKIACMNQRPCRYFWSRDKILCKFPYNVCHRN